MNNKLVAYRNLLGYSQKQMAEASGMCLTSYCQKENGKKDFTQSEIKTITAIIREKVPDITPNDIFFGNEVIKLKTQQNTA